MDLNDMKYYSDPMDVLIAKTMYWIGLPEGVTQQDMEEMILTKGTTATMNWLQEKFREQQEKGQ